MARLIFLEKMFWESHIASLLPSLKLIIMLLFVLLTVTIAKISLSIIVMGLIMMDKEFRVQERVSKKEIK